MFHIAILINFIFVFSIWAESPLHTDGLHLKDKRGRVAILRGFNVSGAAKIPDFRHAKALDDLNLLTHLGTNVIRLLFNWEAFEENVDEYNENYLEYYKSIVRKAHELRINVIIDFHQDGYSRYALSGCGEGFPKWAVPIELRDEPRNDESCKSWYFELLKKKNRKLFNNFYYGKSHKESKNSPLINVREKYMLLMERLALEFKDSPNVLGFDVINEPWGKRSGIYKLYNEAQKRIRKIFPSAIMFLSPHGISSTGIFCRSIPRPSFKNYVFAPHYYAISINPSEHWSRIDTAWALRPIKKRANRIDAPLFLGEFGAPANTVHATEYIHSIMNYLDESFSSGAQWEFNPKWDPVRKDGWNGEDFSIIDDQGNIRPNYSLRPFTRYIAGTPIFQKNKITNIENGFRLQLHWKHQTGIGGTEIFIPNLKKNIGDLHFNFNFPQESCFTDFEKNLMVCDPENDGEMRIVIDC